MKKIMMVAGVLVCALPLFAKIKLGTPFADGMVLQRGMKVPVWGTAETGKMVTVSFAGAELSAVAGADGKWMVKLPKMEASKESRTMVVIGDGRVEIRDVLVGEVWFASGQSNMECPIWGDHTRYRDGKGGLMTTMTYLPYVRFAKNGKRWTIDPTRANVPGWKRFEPASFTGYTLSAVAFYYARELYLALDVPIGIVDASWGGTNIDAWTPRCGYEGCDKSIQMVADHPVKRDWKAETDKIWTIDGARQQPTVLWNAMVDSWTPMAMRGFIWYQGCSNVGNAPGYEAGFQAMIEDWRAQWKSPEMPFYFVQLANFLKPSDLQPESQWALLREAQAKALALKGTGMAVNIDLGDEVNIHPGTKRELARRLSRIALNQTYGQKKVNFTAPIYQSYRVEGNEMRIQFSEPTGYEPFEQDENLPGFIVAGADRKWHVAKARTEGNEVIVSCPEVKTPLAARYGWADNPTCTLKTKSNLHVAPFRTDNW